VCAATFGAAVAGLVQGGSTAARAAPPDPPLHATRRMAAVSVMPAHPRRPRPRPADVVPLMTVPRCAIRFPRSTLPGPRVRRAKRTLSPAPPVELRSLAPRQTEPLFTLLSALLGGDTVNGGGNRYGAVCRARGRPREPRAHPGRGGRALRRARHRRGDARDRG